MMERAVKNFHHYTSEQRTDRAASFRLHPGQRESIGEVFWTHPAVPGLAFPTRKRAEEEARRAVANQRVAA